MKVTIVGAGYMGSAHARVLARIRDEYPWLLDTVYVVDVDRERARRVAARYGFKPLFSVSELPEGVDFAFVVVPTRLHVAVSLELMGRGVAGLMVEKPLAPSLAEAVKLLEEAERRGVWMAVGHIERVNPAVWRLHGFVASGTLGEVLGASARRVGPYAPRAGDIDVVHDLAVHELDNLMALMGGLPDRVEAYTHRGIVSGLSDHALLVAGWGDRYASIEVSRITPYKQRLLHLTGTRGVAELDYMAQSLTIYTGEGELRARVDREEPLYLEDLMLLVEYSSRRESLLDAAQGAAAVAACDAALHGSSLEGLTPWLDKVYSSYRRYREAVQASASPQGYIESLQRR